LARTQASHACAGERLVAKTRSMTDVEWRVAPAPLPYPDALAEMDRRAEAIRTEGAPELIWLLEHPPLYTAGTSADPAELFNPGKLPVYEAGRGGRYTYHGPGQRVGYILLDLAARGHDVRRFVHSLEGWVIATLGELGIDAYRIPGRIGIWVRRGTEDAKIGAIGVRIRRWVTMHGFSVNIDPELSHFSGIVPCGIADAPVTSLDEMGLSDGQDRFDRALRQGLEHFLASLGGRV
jgi:lipoyl(octanoyl) transferase